MNVSASRTAIVGVFALSLLACTKATMTTADALQAKTVYASPTLLTRSELQKVSDGKNLYDAVYELRPAFLRGRNTNPSLAINGQLVGTASFMTTMQPGEVESVELLDGLDATTRFGARHTGSVLMISVRPR